MKIDHFRRPRAGGKFAIVLAVLGALAVAALFGMSASAARAATGKATVTFASHPSAPLAPLNHFTQLPHGIQPDLAFLACQGMTELTPTGTCTLAPPSDEGVGSGAPALIPHTAGGLKPENGPGGGGNLGSNFDGISDVSQRTTTGFHFTPPDQGLCIGPASALEGAGVDLGVSGNTSVIVEMVNDGWGVFSKDGQQLWLDSNIDLFGDPFSAGDPECNYDPQSKTFFFTEIGALTGEFYGTNLVVMNKNGYGAYFVDTAQGGFCFPDFPHQGTDNNALYITINEFCDNNQNDFNGVNVYAISKQQLANLTDPSNVNGVFWTLGINYYAFRPASGDPTNTEYLLASEQNDVTQNALDVAWVTGDNKLAKGSGPVILSLTSIPSESFTEPIEATSTGDGTTCVRTFHTDPGQPDDQTWCSIPEDWLEPNDMRLGQVQYANGRLYSTLETSLTVGNDPTVVDGTAWFQVDPKALKVTRQGYVAVGGTNLLMPSLVSSGNTLLMGFSATSPSLDPSTGYAISKNGGKTWSGALTGLGSGPHVSFSGNQPGYLRRRWGDYSRIAMDPANGDVWFADEYVPGGAAGADQVDNWGTRVWQVK